MIHSHSNIWTHLVLWTKDHAYAITSEKGACIKKVLEDFPLNFSEKQVHWSVLPDHLHLLIKVPGNISVDQLAKEVKYRICTKLEEEGLAEC
ncbi:MAG: transposase, partial [Bacteroidetes bacterium]|nr:transposase [Bacteroidota bacterium]